MDIKRFELTELKEKIAKHIFHELHPVTDTFPDYWGITGTMDDESWRRLERHCFYSANQILSLLEPVELEALGDEELKAEVLKYAIEICQSNPIQEWNQTEVIRRCIQATIHHNQKGQLYRVKEG